MKTVKTIAVIGSGVAGISAAWHIDPSLRIIFLEQDSRLGGHTHTHSVNIENKEIRVDSGFIVFNKPNYPMFMKWLKELNVDWSKSDMSFSFSLDNGSFEWSGKTLSSVFAQKSNLLSPNFYYMLFEINRFNKLGLKVFSDPTLVGNTSIKEFLSFNRFGEFFCNYYLYPMASAIWSAPGDKIVDFPAINLISFFHNHGLLNLSNHFDWYSIKGGSKTYIEKFLSRIKEEKRNIQIKLSHKVSKIEILHKDGASEENIGIYGVDNESKLPFELKVDGVVLACHSNQSSKLVNQSLASFNLLRSIKFQKNTAILHTDESVMPFRKKVWSAWNYISKTKKVTNSPSLTVTYWMNALQKLATKKNLFVTLNADTKIEEEKILNKMFYEHPLYNSDAITAQSRFKNIQGDDNFWFAGSWLGYGFHEDGFVAGKEVAEMINKKFKLN